MEKPENGAMPVGIYLTFTPFVTDVSSNDPTAKIFNRDHERIMMRLVHLSKMEELQGIFVFHPFSASQKDDDPSSFLTITDPDFDALDEGQFRNYLNGSSELGSFTSPSQTNEILIMLTNGKLVGENLAIMVGRAILMGNKPLSVLTAELLKDPWPALAILFFAKSQEWLFHKADTNFENRWSAAEVYEWITTGQGKETIDNAKDIFGIDGAEKLKSLLENLPLPGGLDESDLRAVSYSDPPARTDLLNLKQYIQGFKRLILHQRTTTPLTIAIIGEWGKGKTSFMQFLRRELEDHRLIEPKNSSNANDAKQVKSLTPKAVTVWFDAWQYDSEEKILAALLQTLAKEIETHFSPYSWLSYRFEMGVEQLFSSWQAAYRLVTTLIVIPVALAVATFLVVTFGIEKAFSLFKPSEILKGDIQNLITRLSGPAVAVVYLAWRLYRRINLPLGLDLSKLYEEKDHSARLGFLAVFKEEFQRRIEQMRRMPPWSFRKVVNVEGDYWQPEKIGFFKNILLFFYDIGRDFRDYVKRHAVRFRNFFSDSKIQEQVTSPDYEKGNRIVVFIDDLDRCRPDRITDILETIKVTLDTKGIVFVLGMDDQYVKSGIYLRYKNHIMTQRKFYPAQNAAVRPKSENHTYDAGKKDTDLPDWWPMSADSSSAEEKIDAQSPNWWPNRYLEKIIQMPFKLPDARLNDLNRLVGGVLDIRDADDSGVHPKGDEAKGDREKIKEVKKQQQQSESSNQEQYLSEIDSPLVNNLIYSAANNLAEVLHSNPRRIKAFVNRCRLGLYLLKLHFLELTEGDYSDAVNYFKKWERDRLEGRSREDSALKKYEQPIHELLFEIHGCIFK